MSVSVIIPVAAGSSVKLATRALTAHSTRQGTVELLTITGQQPAQQRNVAAQRASGDVLYFLDHDSVVQQGTLDTMASALARTGAGAAGGPNLGSLPASCMQAAGDLVLGSRLGSPYIYHRYRVGGTVREAGEKSLILCNLMVRKDLFLKLGGFDPRLYPNEENEFLNRLRDAGARAVYVPEAPVVKARTASLRLFAKENFRYGRGRMEQVWVNVHGGDAVFLGLLAGLLGMTVAALSHPGALWLLPAYLLVVAAESARLVWGVPRRSNHRAGLPLAAATAGLMVLRHVVYLAGLIWGALTGWRARAVRIRPMRMRLRTMRLRHGRSTLVGEQMLEVGFVASGAHNQNLRFDSSVPRTETKTYVRGEQGAG